MLNIKHRQTGATLLEGLIAIAVFSIGILGLGALQLTMMKSSQESRYRAIASYYAEEIIGLAMSDNVNNRNTYTVSNGACGSSVSETQSTNICTNWLTRVAQDLPVSSASNEKTAITIANDGTITVTIRWKRTNDTEVQQYSTSTNLNLLAS